MKKAILALASLLVGFASVFLAAGVHSLFFVLLPLEAFAFGYFATGLWGLFYGLLLFAGYSLATALMWSPQNVWYPFQYVAAFIAGGFIICLVGALASLVRKGKRTFGSLAALAVLAVALFLTGYSATTQYGYYYQVIITSSHNIQNLELYLPLATASGQPVKPLYGSAYQVPGYLTENYAIETVTTENGKMLKLSIPSLNKDDAPITRYTGNVIFWQKKAPRQLVHLMPRLGDMRVDPETRQRFFGPVKVSESVVVNRFKSPIRVVSGSAAPFSLSVENRTDRNEWVNFAYGRSDNFSERGKFDGTTGQQWLLMEFEATNLMRISSSVED